MLAVLAVDGIRHHYLYRPGILTIEAVHENGVNGGSLKKHIGLAVRGVKIDLRRTLGIRGSGSRLGCLGLRRGCRPGRGGFGGAFRRAWSTLLCRDKIRRKPGLERHCLLCICDGIAGRLRRGGWWRYRDRNSRLRGIGGGRYACGARLPHPLFALLPAVGSGAGRRSNPAPTPESSAGSCRWRQRQEQAWHPSLLAWHVV